MWGAPDAVRQPKVPTLFSGRHVSYTCAAVCLQVLTAPAFFLRHELNKKLLMGGILAAHGITSGNTFRFVLSSGNEIVCVDESAEGAFNVRAKRR